jgi:ABC-type uncharacterized transport system substrate-binding protein
MCALEGWKPKSGVGGLPALTLLFGLFLLPLLAAATPLRVVVVGGESTYHRAVFAAMRQVLERTPASYELTYRTLEQYQSATEPSPAMLVTVGTAAARTLAAAPRSAPLLCTLLPRDDYLQLPQAGAAEMSALYIEQPVPRYLRLVRLALPQRTNIGAVLGPVSSSLSSELQAVGDQLRLPVNTVTIGSDRELAAALEQVGTSAGVLLALPDPVVVNADTARSLILTAYHRGIALVGYSQALAKAGALMAVHTTPEQFGQEAGEMVHAALTAAPARLPRARFPSYFTVSVNYQVARALELNLPPEEQLLQQLQQPEAMR